MEMTSSGTPIARDVDQGLMADQDGDQIEEPSFPLSRERRLVWLQSW
jgi:hypothetical protein